MSRYDVMIIETNGRASSYTKDYENRGEAREEAMREFPDAKIITVTPEREEARAA